MANNVEVRFYKDPAKFRYNTRLVSISNNGSLDVNLIEKSFNLVSKNIFTLTFVNDRVSIKRLQVEVLVDHGNRDRFRIETSEGFNNGDVLSITGIKKKRLRLKKPNAIVECNKQINPNNLWCHYESCVYGKGFILSRAIPINSGILMDLKRCPLCKCAGDLYSDDTVYLNERVKYIHIFDEKIPCPDIPSSNVPYFSKPISYIQMLKLRDSCILCHCTNNKLYYKNYWLSPWIK